MKIFSFLFISFFSVMTWANTWSQSPVIKLSAPSTFDTCYLAQQDSGNYPMPPSDWKYEWAYSSTNASWTGASHDANSGYTFADCGWDSYCTLDRLDYSATYFFSARYIYPNGRRSLWSPVVACTIQ